MVEPGPFDVAVIGGGVIGLSCAWRLAETARSVVLLASDQFPPATSAAAGMLAPVAEAHFGEERLARLNSLAALRWPAFAAEIEAASGRDVGYLRSGSLMVALDPSDRRQLDVVHAFQRELGLESFELGPSACRAKEPLLTPGMNGGLDLPGDHQVDNRLLLEALWTAVARAGVNVVHGEAGPLVNDQGVVTGVHLASGRILPANVVVMAAGAASGRMAADAAAPPVRPVKGLTIRLTAPSGAPRMQRIVRGLVHGRSCYLVPRQDGSVVLGATVEEKGFDLAVQFGPVHDLMEDARRLLPTLGEYTLDDIAVGLRPGTPDNGPIVGWSPVPGLLWATGHYRNGILLAPVTADEVVSLLDHHPSDQAGGDPDRSPFADFRPDRFVARRS